MNTETCGNCRHPENDHRTIWWMRVSNTLISCAAEGCVCPEFVGAA